MRLTPDVCLVGGGMFGFGLTSPGDCHVYLLDGGDELVLIDAGIGGVAGDPEDHRADRTGMAMIRPGSPGFF